MTHFLRILTRTAHTRTRIIRFLRGTRESFKKLLSNLSILSKTVRQSVYLHHSKMHINTLKVCSHITGSYIPTNHGFATEKPIVCYRQTHPPEIAHIYPYRLDKNTNPR